MAVPTVQSQSHEPRPEFWPLAWARKLGNSLGRPVFAVVLSMIAGAIVIMISPGGSPGAAASAYQTLFQGSFGDPQSISFTLVRVGPLILTGLGVAIAFRAGLFNIGAEGQLAIGAMVAGIIAFKEPHWPAWALIPLMLIASIIAGAIWGGIAGWLKAWRGAHEVVTTIMLNWIAFYLTDYLIDGPFKAPSQATQTPPLPAQATLPRLSTVYDQLLGGFLPRIDPNAYNLDVGFLLALLALVVYWFITSRTTFGYELRVIGQNPKAARYAGIRTGRNIFLVMAISGAFSGLAGAIHLMGQFPYTLIATTFSIDPTGFDAIAVSLLGRTTAIGVLLASLFFGGLRQGGYLMQLNANIPGDLVYIIQALVLFCIAAEFLPVIQRALPAWMSFSRRPALATNIKGPTIVDLPREGAASPNGEPVPKGDVAATDSATVEPHSERVEED
jgi:ABC-type uncharacterized transport system permease subunit